MLVKLWYVVIDHMICHMIYTQPLPEHGVYTVFVDLGNTKIEVMCSGSAYIMYMYL